MHALLLAADPRTAAGLAAAWRAGGAGTVEAGVLPPAPPAAGASPADGRPPGAQGPDAGPDAGRDAGPAPVLVPVSALLRRPGAEVPPARPLPAWAAPLAAADLVVVHLERLDARGLHGPPLADVVAVAAPLALPVVVLARRSEAARREWSAAGLSGVHEVGPAGDGPVARAEQVARAAATWAPRWREGEAPHGGRPLPHDGSRA
ncbi:hypothetical protein [Puerhibacterium sp. TATVAM-FAB25]|uniref:hypothetical protein n=1 Tax=Puerhibacterium sp. TATVAM-FAB25 TaxID=3093699 RepID=UPI00397CCCBB